MLRYNRGTEKGKTNEKKWTTTEKRSVIKHNTIGHFKAKKTTLKKVVKCPEQDSNLHILANAAT